MMTKCWFCGTEIHWKFFRGKFRPYEMTPESKIHRCKCYPTPEPVIQKIGELEQQILHLKLRLEGIISCGFVKYKIPIGEIKNSKKDNNTKLNPEIHTEFNFKDIIEQEKKIG